MKFVLLGDDPACLPLLRAIARAPQHELAVAAHVGDLWPRIASIFPQARLGEDWRELLVEPDVGAVIVAGHSSLILEGALALARAGRPLVVFPDLRQTSAFIYRLWPLDEERRTTLVPLLGTAAGERWRVVREEMSSLMRGPVRYAEIERTGASPLDTPVPIATAEHHLLHDFDLLRRLCGDFSRVTCVALGLSDNAVGRLEVTLTGSDVPEAKWNISACAFEDGATLEVVGPGPTLGYEMSALSSRGFTDPHSTDSDPEGDLQLAIAVARLSGVASEPRWSDVVKAFDVVEAARRSLRRQRTVPIGSEEISEVRQFKSLMTAAGCGVLMYTMLGVIAALLFGAMGDPRDAAQRRAAAAGFIVRAEEFAPDAAELTADGRAHAAGIASRLWQTTADVIVQSTEPANASLDEQRRSATEQALSAEGASRIEGRVIVRALTGEWFERLMLGVWTLVFAPLVILLASQLLRFAARPD